MSRTKQIQYIAQHAIKLSYHKLKAEKKLRDISYMVSIAEKENKTKAMTDAYHQTRDLLTWFMNFTDYHRNAIIKHAISIDPTATTKTIEKTDVQVQNMLTHPERLGSGQNAL